MPVLNLILASPVSSSERVVLSCRQRTLEPEGVWLCAWPALCLGLLGTKKVAGHSNPSISPRGESHARRWPGNAQGARGQRGLNAQRDERRPEQQTS